MSEQNETRGEKLAFWDGVTGASLIPMATVSVAFALGAPAIGGILAGFITAGAVLVARGRSIALRREFARAAPKIRGPGPAA